MHRLYKSRPSISLLVGLKLNKVLYKEKTRITREKYTITKSLLTQPLVLLAGFNLSKFRRCRHADNHKQFGYSKHVGRWFLTAISTCESAGAEIQATKQAAN
jgi:hypothetical protein